MSKKTAKKKAAPPKKKAAVKKHPAKAPEKKKAEKVKTKKAKPPKFINTGEQNFNLSGIEVKDSGANTTVNWTCRNTITSEIDTNSKETRTIPHIDLINALRAFKPALLKGARHHDDRSKENDTIVTKVVTGGSDELMGIKIIGKLKALNGAYMSIQTPFIHLKRSVYGFEDDCLDMLNNLENEARLFVREGKKDQAIMLDDPEFEKEEKDKQLAIPTEEEVAEEN